SSSYPDYADLRARTRAFQELAAFVRMPMSVEVEGRAARLPVEAVTENFFSMLQLAPAAGRAFREGDSRVAMVSGETANAGAIGSRIAIEGEPFTIVGIVPPRYHGTNLNWGDPPRVWIPLKSVGIVQPRFEAIDIFHRRGAIWLLVTGRLKPGVSVETAQAEMRTLTAAIAQSELAADRDLTAVVFGASGAKFWPSYRQSVSRSLTVFAFAAGMLLILTCANLSNLLLTRAVGRRREFAIRLSIGAQRARLLRQLMTETILLGVPGCGAALAIAYGLGRILTKFPNALGLPLALDARIEPRVLIFCMALSIVASLTFALAPAIRATRTDVLPALKESGNAVSAKAGARQGLIAVQVAFSVALLIGGGLFIRSVMSAWAIDPGFRAKGLLTAEFFFPANKPATERMRAAQSGLMTRLRTAPGVAGVTLASEGPFSQIVSTAPVESDGRTAQARRYDIGPDFFRTLRIPLLKGREFTDRDDAAAPRAVIVSQSLAEKLWPSGDALGQTIRIRKDEARVVGVAAGARYSTVWDDAPDAIYMPIAGASYPASTVIVRASGFGAALNRAWNGLMPQSPLDGVRTGEELL
ncbi:MAG: ABC transporter permease, partial [Acidobacteriota bacterium]|nr:ABC transporter permease [Acidobacteriota bacterium]